jgi:peptidoglycan/xylan/chitin deacetylase (PgdA/CDA1 family)
MIGCSANAIAGSEILEPTPTASPKEFGRISTQTHNPIRNTAIVTTPTIINLKTLIPSATKTYLSTETSVPSVSSTYIWNPVGDAIAPILLYHHVSDADSENRYFVTLDNFRSQLKALQTLNYTTITAANLAEVIRYGGELPPRPVVITFDDGYTDIFEYAFPIMQELGFIGVIYIYVDQVGLNGFVNYEQIKTLAESGWEIGNHSMSHEDLSRNHSDLAYEVRESRFSLQQAVGVKIETFAYPYGKSDEKVIAFVKSSDYLAGMGLGLNWHHTIDSLYDLSRIEVRGDVDISSFIKFLPWTDE